MNQIEHILHPERLLLVWRPTTTSKARTRRVVAEVLQPKNGEGAVLRYLSDSPDFANATAEGFQGYPAFRLEQTEHVSNVLDSFVRRLPPRSREDFDLYLKRHRLPSQAELSDMALLAYTNAKLPSDGFELFPDLTGARPPFEVVIEVAGFRHQDGIAVDDIYVGDPVVLKTEPENPHDANAIGVYHNAAKIGYIDRAQALSFQSWLRKGYNVNATIERINGHADRPLVYIFVTVR
jgi:HIRAN domain